MGEVEINFLTDAPVEFKILFSTGTSPVGDSWQTNQFPSALRRWNSKLFQSFEIILTKTSHIKFIFPTPIISQNK